MAQNIIDHYLDSVYGAYGYIPGVVPVEGSPAPNIDRIFQHVVHMLDEGKIEPSEASNLESIFSKHFSSLEDRYYKFLKENWEKPNFFNLLANFSYRRPSSWAEMLGEGTTSASAAVDLTADSDDEALYVPLSSIVKKRESEAPVPEVKKPRPINEYYAGPRQTSLDSWFDTPITDPAVRRAVEADAEYFARQDKQESFNTLKKLKKDTAVLEYISKKKAGQTRVNSNTINPNTGKRWRIPEALRAIKGIENVPYEEAMRMLNGGNTINVNPLINLSSYPNASSKAPHFNLPDPIPEPEYFAEPPTVTMDPPSLLPPNKRAKIEKYVWDELGWKYLVDEDGNEIPTGEHLFDNVSPFSDEESFSNSYPPPPPPPPPPSGPNLNMAAPAAPTVLPTYRDYKRALGALSRIQKRQRYANAVSQLASGLGAQFNNDYVTASAARDARTGFPFYGRGAYSLGDAWRSTVGKSAGRRIRNALVDKGLAMISGQGMYTGHGAYNNLISNGDGAVNSVPSISAVGDETGAIIITHKEYVTDIFGPSTSFNNQSYSINPGLNQTFPFLAQLAANYEEYELIQLVYEYRSTTTDIGTQTNGQCGTVVMVTNYNAASQPFTDKGTMMEYAHAMSCKTTEHMQHGVECEPSKLSGDGCKYVRTNPVVSNQDIKTYDWGLFQIAVCNAPSGFANYPLGELWVYYTVKLSKPRLFVTRGYNLDIDQFVTPTTVARGATATAAVPFPTSGVIYSGQQNNIGCLLTPGGGGTSLQVTFPAAVTGSFRLTLIKSSIGAVAGANMVCPGIATAGNVFPINDFYAVGGSATSTVLDTANSSGPVTVGQVGNVVVITDRYITSATGGVNNTITFSSLSTGSTGPAYWHLKIEQYNGLGITNTNGRLNWVTTAGTVIDGNSV